MGNLNVVILAGGESSRFWPLKEKNSYTFLGKTNIELHVERFKKIKNSKIHLITPLKQVGSGMAGAVLTALKEIDLDEELLILNANDYYDESLITDFLKIRDN